MDGGYAGMLEASGADACDWLLGDGFEARLFTFFPCTDITPGVANKSRDSVSAVAAMLDDANGSKEVRAVLGCCARRACCAWPAAELLPAAAFCLCSHASPGLAHSPTHPSARPAPARVQTSVEQRCTEAFSAVRHFEKTHCLALQNMGYAYLQRRAELVSTCLDVAAR